MAGNRCVYSLNKIIKSNLILRSLKIKDICTIVVRSIVTSTSRVLTNKKPSELYLKFQLAIEIDHIMKMKKYRIPKLLLVYKISGRKKKRRPRKRWKGR